LSAALIADIADCEGTRHRVSSGGKHPCPICERVVAAYFWRGAFVLSMHPPREPTDPTDPTDPALDPDPAPEDPEPAP
jgi:hypothetical protein